MRFQIISDAIVWRADRADPIGHACEPRVIRLASGSIVLSHRVGTRRDSVDGQPQLLQSDDNGSTWTVLGRPFDNALPKGWDLRGASLTETLDGQLLAVVVALDKRLDRPAYNPLTEGLVPVRNIVARSNDGGRTWSEPSELGDGRFIQLASQGLLTLPSGEILCTFETFKSYDDPEVWRYRGGVLRSGDGGRTWGDPVISAASDHDNDSTDTMWWDPRIARLQSGELVQFYYAFRHATRSEGAVHVAWSSDEGRTWTPPTSTGVEGQATYPLPLADGRLAVFQQRRSAGQTMVMHLSNDGGRTFVSSSETVVYKHPHPSAAGATGKLSAFDYLMSMDGFTFGHPCGVVVGPEEILVLWYAGGLTRTQIRAALIRVSPS